MRKSTRKTAKPTWTVSLEAVREAALSIVSDAEALDFTCAAITLGVSGREASLIGELIHRKNQMARGGVPVGCF